jgi:hypothetical protein
MAKKRRAGARSLPVAKPGAVAPQPHAFTRDTLLQAGAFALIFCATIVAYLPALRGAFLWDDDGHITKPELQSLHGLWRIWFDLGATQQYYPVLHSAFWLEHLLWGDAVLGYHLTNVFLHAGAACLLVLLVRRLDLPGAWLAGFVLALHPVCVEAVAWISEQKSTLSGFLYLASALVYLHFDRSRIRSRFAIRPGAWTVHPRAALQDRNRNPAGDAASGHLVAAGSPPLEARCAALAAVVRSQRIRGRSHFLCGADLHRRQRLGFRSHSAAARHACRPRHLVLCR